jgi:hypothetical protein
MYANKQNESSAFKGTNLTSFNTTLISYLVSVLSNMQLSNISDMYANKQNESTAFKIGNLSASFSNMQLSNISDMYINKQNESSAFKGTNLTNYNTTLASLYSNAQISNWSDWGANKQNTSTAFNFINWSYWQGQVGFGNTNYSNLAPYNKANASLLLMNATDAYFGTLNATNAKVKNLSITWNLSIDDIFYVDGVTNHVSINNTNFGTSFSVLGTVNMSTANIGNRPNFYMNYLGIGLGTQAPRTDLEINGTMLFTNNNFIYNITTNVLKINANTSITGPINITNTNPGQNSSIIFANGNATIMTNGTDICIPRC